MTYPHNSKSKRNEKNEIKPPFCFQLCSPQLVVPNFIGAGMSLIFFFQKYYANI